MKTLSETYKDIYINGHAAKVKIKIEWDFDNCDYGTKFDIKKTTLELRVIATGPHSIDKLNEVVVSLDNFSAHIAKAVSSWKLEEIAIEELKSNILNQAKKFGIYTEEHYETK